MVRVVAALVIAAMLAACSSHPTATTAAAAGTNPSPPAPAATNALAGTPMAVYGRDLNQAKNVQNIVNQQAKKQARAIGAATGRSH